MSDIFHLFARMGLLMYAKSLIALYRCGKTQSTENRSHMCVKSREKTNVCVHVRTQGQAINSFQFLYRSLAFSFIRGNPSSKVN